MRLLVPTVHPKPPAEEATELSPEISKNPEPSEIHGTFYCDLLCEQIKRYKGQINPDKPAQ